MTFNAIKNQPIGVNEKVDYLRESAKSLHHRVGFLRFPGGAQSLVSTYGRPSQHPWASGS